MAAETEPDIVPAEDGPDAGAPDAGPTQAHPPGQSGDADPPEEASLPDELLADPSPDAALTAARPRKLPILQFVLLINTVLVAIVIVLLLRPSAPATAGAQRTQSLWPVPAGVPTTSPAAEAPAEAPGPTSWRVASQAYADGDYSRALGHYRRLLERSRAVPGSAATSDLCRLCLARCQARLGLLKEARTQLDQVAGSPSPVLRAAAAHDTAMLEYLSGNYASARAKAYSAIAAVGAVETPLSIETDCDYLIAQSLTATVLAGHQISLPADHDDQPRPDPFDGLAEDDLHRLLAEGRSLAGGAVLGPRIEASPARPLARRYAAACRQAPLDDVLHRLSVTCGMEIRWANVDEPARRRAVTLGLRSASAQRICEVACGATGLLVRFTGGRAVVYNPHSCKSLSEQRNLVGSEAVSAWRRFFLTNPGDARLPRGHFALAALQECRGELLSAVKEYRLVATRFQKESVAGSALLRGARLKIRLGDFEGARRDLLTVLDLYPDCRYLDEVHLSLAQAYLNEGILDEAIPVFQKLYHLDLSARSRVAACLGAARSFIAKRDDKQACVWLDRYLKLRPGAVGPEAAGAHLMVGRCKARLGDPAEASAAFDRALRARPSNRQRSEIMLHLAVLLKDSGRYVRAIRALGKVVPEALAPAQRIDYLLAKARTYQAMGLTEKALAMLRREVATTRDPAATTAMVLEMAHYAIELGDLSTARGLLAELLPRMKPGPATVAATCDLAETCLADGKTAQAVAISKDLLRSADADNLPRILHVLGRALVREGKYDRAALALSGLAAGKKEGGGK